MEFIFLAFIFIIGLCIGSFLSVFISRLDRKEGIAGGRSECPDCGHQLAWYDLFPVLSYLWLKGKCRYCGSGISSVYPMLELTTALSLTTYIGVSNLTFSLETLYFSILLVLFTSLIYFDFLYLILPDKVVFSIGGLAVLHAIFFRNSELINLLLSGFLFAVAFAIIYLATKGRAMGFGDVKLAFVIGLVLGYPLGFFAVILSIWSAALWGMGLMVLKRANMKTALPFGSFLASATIIFIIFGKIISEKIDFYNYFL